MTDPLEAQALELIGLAEKATGGEWKAVHNGDDHLTVVPDKADYPVCDLGSVQADDYDADVIEALWTDARLIAAAKNTAPAIARAHLEARAEIKRLRDVAARLERHVALKAFDTFAGKDRWKSDALIALLEETQTVLYPQSNTPYENPWKAEADRHRAALALISMKCNDRSATLEEVNKIAVKSLHPETGAK